MPVGCRRFCVSTVDASPGREGAVLSSFRRREPRVEDSRLGQLSAALLPAATCTACRVAEPRLARPGPVSAGASRGGRDGAQRAGSLGHA